MVKGNLKKGISLVVALMMVLSLCFIAIPKEVYAANPVVFTVTSSEAEVQRGDTFTVSVEMEGNTEGVSINFQLPYNEDCLKLVDATKGDVFNTPGSFSNLATPSGSIGATIAGMTVIEDGSVVTATFEVLDTAEGNLGFKPTVQMTDDTIPDPIVLTTSITESISDMRVEIPAAGISLDESSIELIKNDSKQLTATIDPANATGVVKWESSDSAVAEVSSTGLVTAKSGGKATITATINGKSASCDVQVKVPLTGITITGTETEILKGESIQLNVTYDPTDTTDDKTITWSSTPEGVVDISQNGVVTGKAAGTATITATTKTGVQDTYDIEVKEYPLVNISIPENITINKGNSQKLTVTYNPENTTDDKTVRWTSTDYKTVDVDENGNITAVKTGSAVIEATVGDKEASCLVTVVAPLQSIEPEYQTIDMVKKQTATIGYTLNPTDTTDDKTVKFSSSDPDIAEVNETTGEVTAKKAGTAIITLTGYNDITAEVTVNVKEIPIDTIILSALNKTVEEGESAELTATIGPDNHTDDDTTISWTSSDNSIAKVTADPNDSSKATVEAVKGGKATITATTANGKKATCEIFVPIHITQISLPSETVINRGNTNILDVTYTPADTTDDKTVTWESSDPEIASVDATTGMITALKEGEVEITATTNVEDKNSGLPFSATGKVVVKENKLTSDIAEEIVFEELKESPLMGQRIDMKQQLNIDDIVKQYQLTDDIEIEWSVSDSAVASIDSNGMLSALAKGKTTVTADIKATDGNGNTVVYKVSTEVEVRDIPLESIAFNKVIKEMQVGDTDKLIVIYNPENTTDTKDVIWSSSDETILSVENGVLKALKEGTATITAKVGSQEVSCTITVKSAQTADAAQGTDKSSETGDTMNIAMYAAMMIAALGIALILLKKRNRA